MFPSERFVEIACAKRRLDAGISLSIPTLAGLLLLLGGCGGGSGGGGSGEVTAFSVSGSVSGLRGTGLVLQNNNGDDLPIPADGAFAFPIRLANGAGYNVRVAVPPKGPAQICAVGNGTGTLRGANVTNVFITCAIATFSVGGSVSGVLSSGLLLQNNGSDNVAVDADGTFTFPTKLNDETGYDVRILRQPFGLPAQACTVVNGIGTLHGGGVTAVSVVCTTLTFSIGGTVSGLRGKGLILQNNNGDDALISGDGPFTFSTPLADGSTFNVTVRTQPHDQTQTCAVVFNGTGKLFGGDFLAVTVTCNFTKQLGTAAADELNAAVADVAGNLYVTGRTAGGFDGHANAGGWDAIVIKFGANGDLLWSRQIGTPADEAGNAIAVDSGNNVYVAGSTSGGLDGNANAGSEDIFITKFDADGNRQWTRQPGTTAADVAHGIAVGSDGNVYVAGRTDGDLNGSASAGGTDLFVLKYDVGGNLLWTRQFGTTAFDAAFGIAADGNGGVYVAGGTEGGLDGNTNSGGRAAFVLKYDTAGTRLWTRLVCRLDCFLRPGSVYQNQANGIVSDSAGNVYITGWSMRMNAGEFGGKQVLVAQYLSNGFNPWVVIDGGLQLVSQDNNEVGTAIALAPNGGEVYVTGSLEVDLARTKDFVLKKYDAVNGGFDQLGVRYGTPADDEGFGIAADANGNVYVVGRTAGDLDLNVSAGGGSDAFVAKYNGSGARQ